MTTRELEPERLIMLGTPQSYEPREKKYLRRTAHYKGVYNKEESTLFHIIPVARTFRDECHLSFGPESPIIHILKKLKESWQPTHWFLSATPCPSCPCNTQAFMRLTETPE